MSHPAPASRREGTGILTERLLEAVLGGRGLLIAVASEPEAGAVLRGLGSSAGALPGLWRAIGVGGRASVVLTGVGKANAAGAVGGARGFGVVLSLGLAGALPGSGLSPGAVVVADACMLADEGVRAGDGFSAQSALGFPADPECGERFATDAALRAALEPLADRVGGCATVSTCSGTDELAAEIARRTGALVEDMESAAAALAARRRGLAFACVRVVSNRTGERSRQGWDLAGALGALERVAASI